jgi:uncharacterized protein YndB with AHSA1/START domain
MSRHFTFNPKLDFAIERFIDAPARLVWEALTKPEHLKEWYMPKAWGRVARAEMDVRPGGIFSIDIAGADGQEFPNLGCFLDVIPMERLVWTSMLFPGYRPAVFDDIPITAIVTMETVGTGTRYVFTALHRDEAISNILLIHNSGSKLNKITIMRYLIGIIQLKIKILMKSFIFIIILYSIHVITIIIIDSNFVVVIN